MAGLGVPMAVDRAKALSFAFGVLNAEHKASATAV